MAALPDNTPLHDKYTLQAQIGSGGFGIVYRATTVSGTVAIKECFPAGCLRQDGQVIPASPAAVAQLEALKTRFREQAEVLYRLDHPNIVRALNSFEENGTIYLVMPFIEGDSLLRHVEEQGPLSEAEATDTILALAAAVEAVHAAGLLHLDIKPENVLLDRGTPILVDFDLIQHQDETGIVTRPLAMALQCGTPGYAPIEQYSQRAALAPGTDIYALGATLYHLLTGEPPVPAIDRAAGIALPSPLDKRPDLSPHLGDALARALEVEIGERPGTVAEFVALVRDEAGGEADDTDPAHTLPEGWFAVRMGQSGVRWPRRCACCFARAETAFSYGSGGKKWPLPLCRHCEKHHLAARKAGAVTFYGMGASLIVALAGMGISMQTSTPLPLLLGPAGITLNFAAMTYGAQKNSRAEEMLKPRCTSVSETMSYRFNGKLHIFRFRNQRFAVEFRRLNGAG